MYRLLISFFVFISFWQNDLLAQKQEGVFLTTYKADVCVYGATGSGIIAAIAAARAGKSVIVIEPCHEIGGLLKSGFRMQQDTPFGDHLGSLTKVFYTKDLMQPKPRHKQGAGHYNVKSLYEMIAPYKERIKIIKDHRVSDVKMSGKKIVAATFEYAPLGKYGVPLAARASDNLTIVTSDVYIDSSYEGDLMAKTGVSYRIGKEGVSEYNESMAGVTLGKKFPGVDPYKIEGDPSSGLLSCISPEPLGEIGSESKYFMSYNFKLAWENEFSEEHPGIFVHPPESKNHDVYELLRRYEKAGYKTTWPHENQNRNELMTGAIPGLQLNYPDGTWSKRAEIYQAYIDHVRTLTDFYGVDLRLLDDSNEDTDGWPLLYMRGGRRMLGEYIMKQQDIQLQTSPPDPIGLGYYKVDIYPNRLLVLEDGTLASEGNRYTLVSPGPYQIDYGSLIPKQSECENLLVTLCMSASHIAYSTIRMEVTYMIMGEAAGVAAAMAVDSKTPVQKIDRKALIKSLKNYGQLTEWDGQGYRFYRTSVLSKGKYDEGKKRWEKYPEEYRNSPPEILWK